MKRLALLLADERNAYQLLLTKEARAAAAGSGIELLPPRFAGGLAATQIEQFFECVRTDPRPDGILTMLVAVGGMHRTIEMLAKSGLSFVFLNRVPDFVDQLRDQCRESLFACVSPDQIEIGRIQGRQCLRLVPSGSYVLHMLGASATPSAEERRRGFREVVGDRIVVHELEGYWTQERAETALADWFRLGTDRDREIGLVVCQNDPMARGVRAALSRQALSLNRDALATTPIIGCDGLPDEGQLMVSTKELVATVVMPPTTPRAIEILRAFWERGVRSTSVVLSASSYPPLEELGRS